MAKPVVIGEKRFSSQKEALEHFREMLSRYAVGSMVDGEDAKDLDLLLARHSAREQKLANGCLGFCAMIAPEGTKCFGLLRSDGSKLPFSFIHCVTGR